MGNIPNDTAALLEELQRQRAELQRLSQWQRVILEGANLSIIATAPDGTILSFNHAAEAMLGYRAEEVVGKLTPAAIHDPAEVAARAPELSREIGQTIEPGFDVFVAKTRLGIAEEREWTYIRKDGSRFPVLLSVTALRDAEGAIQGYLGIAIDLTLRKQMEVTAGRARANELSRTLIRALPAGVIGVAREPPHRILFVNPEIARLLGVAEHELSGRALDEVLQTESPAGGGGFGGSPLAGRVRAATSTSLETVARAVATGRVFPVSCTVSPADSALAGGGLSVIACRDISAQREAERKTRLSDKVFEYSAEAIMITDAEGRILNVNPAFTWLTGYRPDEAIGRTPALLKSGRHDAAFYAAMWRALAEEGNWAGELWDRRKDGTEYLKWLSINAVREGGRTTHYVALFSDISERKANEERIEYLANHDHLTGLANRLLLRERAPRALAQASRARGKVGLLFVDLDHFKNINDSLGHHVGDQLLIEVARRLNESVRISDTVARLGGDEFIVLAENLSDHNDAAQVAIKLHEALGRPYALAERTLHVPPSIGIALYPDDGESLDVLMQQADTAMYQVKSSGRNAWLFFAPEMNDAVQERMTMENDLRQSLARGEFRLHFQPQWRRGEAAPFGWEALLRWQHPERGAIAPARFIPVAEETGLILPIGEWVLRAACAEVRAWEAAGLGCYRAAVNLSARQFRQKDIAERIEAVLRETGLPADRLELEITESVLMEDAERARCLLERLKGQGVRVAIDDFGTGYSSLSYLKALPIDRLKIDRSFVADLHHDANDAAIVSAVISLARSLGLSVIAEGVETVEQQAFLHAQGCEEVQGYLLGKPMSGEDARRFLAPLIRPATPRSGAPVQSGADAPRRAGIPSTG